METKRSPQEKFVTLYDTAKKCMLILNHLLLKIDKGCLAAEDSEKVKQDAGIVIELYIDVLGLVDYLHRFHEIVSAMPLLRKDTPELRRLDQSLTRVEEVRNYLQHMRGDLMANGPLTFPVLGAISWVRGRKNYFLLSNQPVQMREAPGIVFDRLESKYVCNYQLAVGGHELKLDTAYDEAKRFWKWLEEHAVIQPEHVKDFAWGTPMILHSEIVTGPNLPLEPTAAVKEPQ